MQWLPGRGFRDHRGANLLSSERPVTTRQPLYDSLPAKKRIAVRGLTKAEAEEVLDLLESRGQTGTCPTWTAKVSPFTEKLCFATKNGGGVSRIAFRHPARQYI